VARVGSSTWLAATLVALLACGMARAERVGEVDTAFKLIGPDHKVVVDAYDDPKVKGVSCYVSRAVTGGVSGALGLAEDKAEAAIACRQVGPISIAQPLPRQEEVFSERQYILFKRLRVVRIVDTKRHTLVYLTYSDKLVEGSPENALAAVPVDASVALTVKP
jgi:CreA protein